MTNFSNRPGYVWDGRWIKLESTGPADQRPEVVAANRAALDREAARVANTFGRVNK